MRSAARRALGLGRATVLPVVVAVMLVVAFGASPASAHKGYKGLFHLGHKNVIATATTLVGKVATGSALVVKNPSGGSALGLEVNAGQAPLTVNASAGKATNLNADKLDDKEASDFYAAGSKVDDSAHADQADNATNATNAENATNANKLDNKNSAEFIQRNATATAQNGSIHIDGQMRTSGMVRTGSETGTAQGPSAGLGSTYNGMVVRRIVSVNSGAGQVIARSDQLRLERDGTFGGLRIAWDGGATTSNAVNCSGIDFSGNPVGKYIHSAGGSSAGTAQVFTDTQNAVYLTCSFGNSYNSQHTTQVILQRRSGDNYWVGTVISTVNQ